MSDFDSNNFDSGFDAYGSADQQVVTEAPKTPTIGYVALILPILAIICSVVSCCCFPILLSILAFVLSVVGLVLNIVAGNQMKAMYGETNGFIKVTRVIEIIIVVLMFFGIGLGIANKILTLSMLSNPNNSYNQLINQLTGNIVLFK